MSNTFIHPAPALTTYYRDDPRNTPHDTDGNAIPGGPWLRVYDDTMPGKQWHYQAMGGQLAIATIEDDTPPGHSTTFIAPDNKMNTDIIQGLEFEHGLFVPFANNEPHNPVQKQFLDETRRLVKGTDIGMTPNLTNVTGARYIEANDHRIQTVEPVTATKYLGTYNKSNTGLIGFVDPIGEVYIGRDDCHYEDRLKETGYRFDGSLNIPFAQGEKLVPREGGYSNHSWESIIPDFQKRPGYKHGLSQDAKANRGLGI